MQKVYLLLRGNQQTGPFSLEELLQFDLKPFDLIWIEGRSAGWYYPQEIPALQPHLSFLKQTPASSTPAPVQESIVRPTQTAGPKKIFVAMPFNTIKEEPTPKPSFPTPASGYQHESTKVAAASYKSNEPEELKTSYAKSPDEVETNYMNQAYQKKAKKTQASAKGLLVACLVMGVAFAGWNLLQPADENLGKTLSEQPAFLPAENELPADNAIEKEPSQPTGKPSAYKKQKQNKATVLSKQNQVILTEAGQKKQQEEHVSINSTSNKEYGSVPEIKEASKPVLQDEGTEAVVTTEAPKEKKKLRDKIADLFKKKPEEKGEEARPVEEENGQRQSTRREAGSSLVQMVTVKFTVPNEWMMGIKGAKATLTNRSSEAIAKAVVEVVYYNDDNDILDKRTISFGSIKSRQTQTVSIPDHQTATRLEYNVVSVTGANEPFAKR